MSPLRSSAPHPAKFSESILDELGRILTRHRVTGTILDPFAGTGKVFALARPGLKIVAIELEPEWASAHPYTQVGDARDLPGCGIEPGSLAAIVTSPCFGNRMADHHEARENSVRATYRHKLGRMPTEGSAAVLQWGREYRAWHRDVYRGFYEALRPGGLAVINVSDFIRGGVVMPVSAWHRDVWLGLGCELLETVDVETPRMRHGRNHAARVPFEQIHVMAEGSWWQPGLFDE
jgi:tRNA G10  N-methylase Trm11